MTEAEEEFNFISLFLPLFKGCATLAFLKTLYQFGKFFPVPMAALLPYNAKMCIVEI